MFSISAHSTFPAPIPSPSDFEYSYGVPMAPGSKVWNLHQYNHMQEARYEELMDVKIELRQKGLLHDANLIQAATNVGMLLHWTYEDVLNVVQMYKNAEGGLTGIVAGDLEGEMELLNMCIPSMRNVTDWNWVMRLRRQFGPPSLPQIFEPEIVFDDIEKLWETYDEGELEQADTRDIEARDVNCAAGDAEKTSAPLLLIKIQAALNVAFLAVLKEAQKEVARSVPKQTNTPWRSRNSNQTKTLEQAFDVASFKHKAVYLLRISNKQHMKEVEHYLQSAAVGKKRFPFDDNSGTAFRTLPGVETMLSKDDKIDMLRNVVEKVPSGMELVKIVVAVFCGMSKSKNGSAPSGQNVNDGWGSTSLARTAVMSLSDEGFLLLECLYRSQTDGLSTLEPERPYIEEIESESQTIPVSEPAEQNPINEQSANSRDVPAQEQRPRLMLKFKIPQKKPQTIGDAAPAQISLLPHRTRSSGMSRQPSESQSQAGQSQGPRKLKSILKKT